MNIIQEKKKLQAQASSIIKRLDELETIIMGHKPNDEQARLIKSQAFSYGVHFQRRKVLRKVSSPGEICVSRRRFSSRKEADQHGKRFTKIHKHVGYDVVRVNRKANAWINWLTGKTNPVL